MTLLDASTRDELTSLYSAKDRHYHSLSHVQALLALLERHRARLADPEAVEAAIWFHDAVYDPRARDNEERSAALARRRLGDARPPVAAERVGRVCAMIEATATHVVPALPEPEHVSDAAIFLDMDLSVLGSGEGVFDAYEAAVRAEYAWVGDEEWRSGRARVLRSFLAREYIFHSCVFREEYEQRARGNIARSLERLGQRE